VIQGVLQAVDRMTASTGMAWILPPLAMVLILAIAGSTSAWDRRFRAHSFLCPASTATFRGCFGANPPREYATPHVGPDGLGRAVHLDCVHELHRGDGERGIRDAARSVSGATNALLPIPLCHAAGGGDSRNVRFGLLQQTVASGSPRFSGLTATTLGLIVAFVPSHQITSIWIFELKMFAGTGLFLGLAAFLFRYYSKRKSESGQT